MDEKELRIGNWLYGKDTATGNLDSHYFQVQSIDDEGINTWRVDGFSNESATDVEPIPLTPEILEKAGFVKWRNSETFEYGAKGEESVQIRGAECFLGGSDAATEGHGFHCEVRHVHQLQNLYFALTGEELQIEL